jgi:hypothetical protein
MISESVRNYDQAAARLARDFRYRDFEFGCFVNNGYDRLRSKCRGGSFQVRDKISGYVQSASRSDARGHLAVLGPQTPGDGCAAERRYELSLSDADRHLTPPIKSRPLQLSGTISRSNRHVRDRLHGWWSDGQKCAVFPQCKRSLVAQPGRAGRGRGRRVIEVKQTVIRRLSEGGNRSPLQIL